MELRHEDVAFVYACMPQCEKVRCVADTLYNYLQRDGSITNSARMQLCAYDFCYVLESLYGYYSRRGLFPRLKTAYETLFVYYFEYPVRVLRGGERRRAMCEYQRMIRLTGMWREYRGRYPFEELLCYNPLRALFYWRNATTRLYKFLKWPILRIEETPQGARYHWF